MYGNWPGGGLAENIGEIHSDPNLGADPWTRDVFATKQSDSESQATAELVSSTYESLELASAQSTVIGESAVKLIAQRSAWDVNVTAPAMSCKARQTRRLPRIWVDRMHLKRANELARRLTNGGRLENLRQTRPERRSVGSRRICRRGCRK